MTSPLSDRGAALTLLGHTRSGAPMRKEALEREAIQRLGEAIEARVSERTRALHETIHGLETITYSVVHDLRSPVGAVINFAAILAEGYGHVLDDPAKDYLRRISSSAKIAVSLMDGLVEFSHSGREEIHKTDVDMRRLVESVLDELIGTDPSIRSTLEIGHLPRAHADAAMIRRVYTNLISNALKFLPPGEEPRVEIGAASEAGRVVYFVRDHGIGFDMCDSKRLFTAFQRLHSSQQFDGHGVGLAIVARLVQRHGGRVWAQGAEGKGATFWFSLPLWSK